MASAAGVGAGADDDGASCASAGGVEAQEHPPGPKARSLSDWWHDSTTGSGCSGSECGDLPQSLHVPLTVVAAPAARATRAASLPPGRYCGAAVPVEEVGEGAQTARGWANAEQCGVCGVRLGKRLLRPRHHCRLCARSVCGACSRSSLRVEGSWFRQRACVPCVASMQRVVVMKARLELLASRLQALGGQSCASASPSLGAAFGAAPSGLGARTGSLEDAIAVCEAALLPLEANFCITPRTPASRTSWPSSAVSGERSRVAATHEAAPPGAASPTPAGASPATAADDGDCGQPRAAKQVPAQAASRGGA
eukprot:TRINITY_DN15043_c1_g1_i1.p2 TRINITY_DN15043_c1_g1~~TRINITY_DN15043_c1_g1_i1.p2  ORF type:complete len:330 (+),score=74.49 TRINITY_DN15043_c1_g1_i1:63-992(+)